MIIINYNYSYFNPILTLIAWIWASLCNILFLEFI